MYYNWNRYYDPGVGRYMRIDPYGEGLNLYGYGFNNPLFYSDPSGLCVVQVVGGGLEAAAGFTFAAGTAVTGVGVVAGGAVGLHGLDQVQAGIRGLFSDQPVDTFTSKGLQSMGMSRDAANFADSLISVVGTMGTSVSTKILRSSSTVSTANANTAGIKALPSGPKVNAQWNGLNNYRHGGQMTAIEHINYRHNFNTGFTNVSKFSKGTSVKNIKSYVDNALRYGHVSQNGVNSFKIEYNIGRAIGTSQAGNSATAIRIFIRDGRIQTAFPISY